MGTRNRAQHEFRFTLMGAIFKYTVCSKLKGQRKTIWTRHNLGTYLTPLHSQFVSFSRNSVPLSSFRLKIIEILKC